MGYSELRPFTCRAETNQFLDSQGLGERTAVKTKGKERRIVLEDSSIESLGKKPKVCRHRII